MEGRKQRRYTKESTQVEQPKVKKGKKENMKKEKRPNKIVNIISKVIMVALIAVLVAVIGIVIYLKVLPNKYLIPLCAIAFVACAAGIWFVFRKKTSNLWKGIVSVFSVVLIAIFSFVGLKLVKTLDFLGEMTTETVNAKTYSVVVLKDSKYTKIEDIQYRLLLYYDNELNQNQPSIEKLTEVMTVVTEKTDNINELANRLVKKEVDAILIEDSYYAIIEEEIEDFREKTSVIYTYTLEDVIQTIAKEVSVTKEPFIVYISGIDSYGKISSVARSDVNMIAVVNPQTKQVLLVNTPRDYYVKLHGTSGYRDKLTHAGIYGIDMSVKTMEDLYDIDVNYYVRVNFTSLINIINAIGGIEVYSEYAFTSRIGKYRFVKGYNKMNGKQALGFARERYSFSEGDRMRGQNQQAVIDAMIKKVCSSTTILTKFDALLDSLKGSFQTNMEYTKMVDLVRMQIAEPAEWNVTSISVDGSGSMERTYSMGKTLLSVLIPYSGSINKAESMIKSVLDGEKLKAGNIDISSYNDYLVVNRGVYPKDEKEEKPKEETKPEIGDETTGENTNNGTQEGENSGETGNENVDNSGNNPSGGSGEETPPTSGEIEQEKPSEGTQEGGNTSGNENTGSGEDKPTGDTEEQTPPTTPNQGEQENPDVGTQGGESSGTDTGNSSSGTTEEKPISGEIQQAPEPTE